MLDRVKKLGTTWTKTKIIQFAEFTTKPTNKIAVFIWKATNLIL